MTPDALVEYAPGRTIIGIETQCFTIEDSDEDELRSDEVCFSNDAIWLYWRGESDYRLWTAEATELQTSVDDADLVPPYALVSPDEVPEMGNRGFLGSTTTEVGNVPPIPLSEVRAAIEDGRAYSLWISTNDFDFYEFRDASGQVNTWRRTGTDARLFSKDDETGTGRPILSASGDTIGLDDETLGVLLEGAKAHGIEIADDRDWQP